MGEKWSVIDGFSDHQRAAAVRLFWAAFKGKLLPVMKPEAKAHAFLGRVADPCHAICVVGADGALLGVAGYKTAKGGFMGGGLRDLCAVYGVFGGVWRGVMLSMLERPLEENTLLMDGIFVDAAARGMGIGTVLLRAIKAKAGAHGYTKVRLDVIDINPRARALYEREGFVAGDSTDIGPLSHIFGFQNSTEMVFQVG